MRAVVRIGACQTPEILGDYLLTCDRMKRYDETGARGQLAAVTELLASRGTTIEEPLTSTIASLAMPGFLQNGLPGPELAALFTRLTA
jgi:hypothetical protein